MSLKRLTKAALVFCAFGLPAQAAQTERVLDLCLDTKVLPEDRIATLQAEGWRQTDGLLAMTVALTLIRLNSGEPEGWKETHLDSADLAKSGLRIANVTYLQNAANTAGVFIGRGQLGLQTCLFVGDDPDLSALDNALDGSIIRTIGEVSRIRGDGVKSLISAHAMTNDGRAVFDPYLPFGLTFAVELDRQRAP